MGAVRCRAARKGSRRHSSRAGHCRNLVGFAASARPPGAARAIILQCIEGGESHHASDIDIARLDLSAAASLSRAACYDASSSVIALSSSCLGGFSELGCRSGRRFRICPGAAPSIGFLRPPATCRIPRRPLARASPRRLEVLRTSAYPHPRWPHRHSQRRGAPRAARAQQRTRSPGSRSAAIEKVQRRVMGTSLCRKARDCLSLAAVTEGDMNGKPHSCRRPRVSAHLHCAEVPFDYRAGKSESQS